MQTSKLMVTEKHKIEYAVFDLPKIQKRQAIIKGIVSGISHGTELAVINKTVPTFHKCWNDDLRCFADASPSKKYPASLGYEYVGRVMEVGNDVDGLLQVGDLIWMDAPHQTLNILDVDKTPYLKLDKNINVASAAFLALTRVALAGVHDAKPKIGDSVFVSGLGTVGLIVVQLLKLAGVKEIIASDPLERRRQKAEEFGAITINPHDEDPGVFVKRCTKSGVDVAIECAGVSQALHDSIKTCGVGGTVVTIATYREGATKLSLGEEWHRNRINLLSSMSVNGCPPRDYPLWNIQRLNKTALLLLQTEKINVRSLISHTFSFFDAEKAFQLIKTTPNETLKVILNYT